METTTASTTDTTTHAPRYLRPKAAAAHLCISLSTLWHWAKSRPGFPQPIKLGEKVTVFDAGHLNQWASEQQAAS